jgi:hypothetical protein
MMPLKVRLEMVVVGALLIIMTVLITAPQGVRS